MLTQMRNDVSISLDLGGELLVALDLVEESGWGELEQVSQQVEPATVRHSNHNFLNSTWF